MLHKLSSLLFVLFTFSTVLINSYSYFIYMLISVLFL